MSNARAVLLVALLSLTAAMAPAQAQDSTFAGGVDLTIPDSIAGFRLVARRQDETAGGGYLLRYRRGDGLVSDVFIYPGPDLGRECALPCARRWLQGEMDTFRSAIPEMLSRHYVDSMVVVSDDTLQAASTAPWRLGRHLVMRVQRAGQPMRSEMYLFYLPGYRVKVRATFPPDAAVQDVVAQFAFAAPGAIAAGAPAQKSSPPAPGRRGR